MLRICTSQSIGYRQNNSVIFRGSPLLKIVPEIPDNVRIIPVAIAKELTVLLATALSIRQTCLRPAPLLERGNQALQPACSSLLHEVINVAPVRLIRSC